MGISPPQTFDCGITIIFWCRIAGLGWCWCLDPFSLLLAEFATQGDASKEIPSPPSQIPDLALLRLRKKQPGKKKWAEWKFKCCNPGGKTFYIISKKVHGRPSSCFYFILLFSGTVDDNFLNLQCSLILKYVLSLPSCPNCCFETTFSSQHQSHFRFKL